MATVKVYPYVTLDENGKLTGLIHIDSYRSKEAIDAGGSLSDYSKAIYVHLPEMEVGVQVPTEQEVQAQAVLVLRRQKAKLRAEHQALMTKFQFMENQLLGLEAPEILDRTDPTARTFKPLESDDDFPF